MRAETQAHAEGRLGPPEAEEAERTLLGSSEAARPCSHLDFGFPASELGERPFLSSRPPRMYARGSRGSGHCRHISSTAGSLEPRSMGGEDLTRHLPGTTTASGSAPPAALSWELAPGLLHGTPTPKPSQAPSSGDHGKDICPGSDIGPTGRSDGRGLQSRVGWSPPASGPGGRGGGGRGPEARTAPPSARGPSQHGSPRAVGPSRGV